MSLRVPSNNLGVIIASVSFLIALLRYLWLSMIELFAWYCIWCMAVTWNDINQRELVPTALIRMLEVTNVTVVRSFWTLLNWSTPDASCARTLLRFVTPSICSWTCHALSLRSKSLLRCVRDLSIYVLVWMNMRMCVDTINHSAHLSHNY